MRRKTNIIVIVIAILIIIIPTVIVICKPKDKDNQADKTVTSTPKSENKQKKACMFCGDSGCYLETYKAFGRVLLVCGKESCEDKYYDWFRHMTDIKSYNNLYIQCKEAVQDEELLEQVNDSVYRIEINNIEFKYFKNDEQIQKSYDDPFYYYLNYNLGKLFDIDGRAKLNAVTYVMTIDFANKEVIKENAPELSQYTP